jgi:hypothetical protein
MFAVYVEKPNPNDPFVADANLVPYIGQVLPMERAAGGLRLMLEGWLAGKIVLARCVSG